MTVSLSAIDHYVNLQNQSGVDQVEGNEDIVVRKLELRSNSRWDRGHGSEINTVDYELI